MRVLVNATSARVGGVVVVVRHLLRTFVEVDRGEHQYIVACRRQVWPEIDPGDPRVTALFSPLAGLGGLGRALWEQVDVPVQAWRRRADVVLDIANLAVPGARVPQVVMFQNMAPYDSIVIGRYGAKGRLRLRALRELARITAGSASDLIFFSDHALRLVGPEIGHGRSLHVIYPGRDPSFSPDALSRAPAVLARLGIAGRFVLTVANVYRYKNLVQLVEGFAQARAELPDDLALVIAGDEVDRAYAAEVRATIHRCDLDGRAVMLGNLSQEDLAPLYAASELFLFTSSCESFGLILVEAMSSGAACLVARVPPMTEIAANAVVYLDPLDPGDVARKLTEVWGDPALRDSLRQRGIARAAEFTWRRTGERVLGVLEQAARAHVR